MSAPARRYVTINLDRPRQLFLSLGAAAELHRLTGLNIFEPQTSPDSPLLKPTPAFFCALVYVCARWEDPALTLEFVSNALDLSFIEKHPGLIYRLLAASKGLDDVPATPLPGEGEKAASGEPGAGNQAPFQDGQRSGQ